MEREVFLFIEDGVRKFPVRDCEDVGKAVHAWGRYVGPATFEDFKRRLTGRAIQIGCESALPAEWGRKALIEAEPGVAVEHAAKSAFDTGMEWLWIGISHNNVRDSAGDYMPRDLIKLDIETQALMIAKRGSRSRKPLYRTCPMSDCDLNGEAFKDYGALLVEHDLRKQFGRTTTRTLLSDPDVARSVESGFFFPNLLREFAGVDPRPAKMSVGYSFFANGKAKEFPIPYRRIYVYERSALFNVGPMNPATLWLPMKASDLKDAVLRSIVDKVA